MTSASMASDMPDVLARICGDTLSEMRRRQALQSIEELKCSIAGLDDRPRGFGLALKKANAAGRIGLIAEIKQASPSGGLIRPSFDPAAIAKSYEAAGATCLSVLTDGPYFQGSPEDLRKVRAASTLPVLRKDFMLDPWQVYESRAMGADCVLLIMAVVSDQLALELESAARDLMMDVLVEVHDRAELDRALELQTPLIGVNNRNLRTMLTDLHTTEDLAPFVPPNRLLIAESGIGARAEIGRLGAAGARCFLVGESLLRQPDVGAAVHNLLGTAAQP